MRNAFMYILIGFIVALSLNNAVNRLCKRCFGILRMMWNSRDTYRMYCVSIINSNPPRHNSLAFVCESHRDGKKFIYAALSAFPAVFTKPGLHMSVGGMWSVLGCSGLSLHRYTPENDSIRQVLRLSNVSDGEVDAVIDWINRYWNNYISEKCR